VTLGVNMVLDYLRHDIFYDPEQNIWIDAVEPGDKYIADPAQNPSSETYIPLSLHFISVSNIAALITSLTTFKVGRNDLIMAPSVFIFRDLLI